MNLYDRIQNWLGSQGAAGDRISDYLSFLRQDTLSGDPAPDEIRLALEPERVLSYIDDEQLAPEVTEVLQGLTAFIQDAGEVKWWYLSEIDGGTEASLHGPYADDAKLLAAANAVYGQQDPASDGLFWLTIGHDGTPDMGEFIYDDESERVTALRRPNPGDEAPITRREQRP